MSKAGRLAGKVALVTGGSRGLGRGIAEGFAAEGAKIVVNYLKDENAAKAAVDAIKKSGSDAISVRADVGEVDDVQRMVDAGVERFGTIDILVNNAGLLNSFKLVDMSVETMKRLFELKNIAGVKDATGNLVRVSTQREAMGPDFNQLSGEDMTALAFNAAGGHGCISVVSNGAPRLCSQLQEATLAGDYVQAMKIQDRLVPLHAAIFLEPGLAGAKAGLALLGRSNEEVRLPLMPVTAPAKAAIKSAMVHAGLLN